MDDTGHIDTRDDPTAAANRPARPFQELLPSLKTWLLEPAPEHPMPAFTWEQLERQLEDLAETPAKARIVGPLVSGLRKQAPFKPSEMVLREILCLAWTLMDEAFQPGLGPGEEAEMP